MDYIEHLGVLKRYMNNKKDISKSKCHIPLMKSILNKHIEIHIPIDFYNKLIEELSNRSLLYLLYLIENVYIYIYICFLVFWIYIYWWFRWIGRRLLWL